MFLQLEIKSIFQRKNHLNYQMLRKLVKTNGKMTSTQMKKVFNASQVEKMLYYLEKSNFIKINDNKVINFNFNTENLKEHIKDQWLLANMILPDQPTFQFKSLKSAENLKSAFGDVINLINSVPFNIVEVDTFHDEREESSVIKHNSLVDLLSCQFKKKNGTILKTYTFCSPAEAVEIFYKKQQERKMWWKKFSSDPGRFQTSVVNNNESDKSLTGEIQAEFPWGLETVEVVKLLPDMCSGDTFFQIKNKRKKFIPQVITSTTGLEKVALTYLCDSYEGLHENTDRDFLRLDRKLAPFKVAFAGTGSSAEICKSLEELALLLAKKIRKLRISVLLLPDVCTISIERQLIRNDALGVPFTIILSEKTLKDGIIAIRSRDTTLKEQSHVSLIASYIEKIINY